MRNATRQRPAVNQDNSFFFDNLAKGLLTIQRCTECNAFRHPPVPMCPQCHSLAWEPREVTGTGTLVTYTVIHHPVVPPFVDGYLVGLVELAEGVRIVTNLEIQESRVEIGMQLQVIPQRYGDLVLSAAYRPGDKHVVISSYEMVERQEEEL